VWRWQQDGGDRAGADYGGGMAGRWRISEADLMVRIGDASGGSRSDVPEPQYDVAISFLAKDEPIAAAIYDRLASGLKVFFFPRSQEELAGTDGLESMRTPFLTGSRVNVVLYRDGWGQTPWTRVEESAIKDACLGRGWSTLFFIMLEKASRLPIWLPNTHVRFNFDDYGIDQAVGAIKARVQSVGGVIERPSAKADALRVRREQQFLADRDGLFRDRRWITETVLPTVKTLLATIDRKAKEIQKETEISVRSGANERHCVLTNDRVSLYLAWRQEFVNTISNADITAAAFKCQLPLPGERMISTDPLPPKLEQYRFKPELSITRDLRWVNEARPAELLSTDDLADKCVRIFLDLVSKANRGDI
jgi:hypothetical protein